MYGKKGQYFSFDAVVATMILVIAFTSLVGYWFGAQSVVEERSNSLYADTLRVSDSLISPGVPSNWTGIAHANLLDNIRQPGLTKGFSNELDSDKLSKLDSLVRSGAPPATFDGNYAKLKKLLRTSGEWYVEIERTDAAAAPYTFGRFPLSNASEVSIAHRGATLNGHPMRIRIFLWRE